MRDLLQRKVANSRSYAGLCCISGKAEGRTPHSVRTRHESGARGRGCWVGLPGEPGVRLRCFLDLRQEPNS
ncbi:DUF6207 family protein [Streptomyces sp. NPDC007907]|uniref:DUF6207 family protein n=1 Tax=Streptomyces sp. NPDC007907 TaxID=3364789 RepID=UPI0036E7F817